MDILPRHQSPKNKGCTRHQSPKNKEEREDVDENDHPIEEVRLTVPSTDDPTLPALTFRTWVLGLGSCIILSFINRFFGFRQNQLSVSSVCVQIASLPIGKMMAAILPTKVFKVPLINWSFTLNPGPFNMKEHVLITIFANSGAGGVYSMNIVTIVKAFYRRKINLGAAFLLTQTTQLLGYGWAGIFRKFLVDSPYMWWPSNLVQVSLFSALHEKEKRPKGGLSRQQFFLLFLVLSFGYYIVPGFFFPTVSTISIVCLIWKNSVTAQQIGSGMHGLGIGSFGLDWSTVAGFLGSPLAVPAFAIFNTMAGFFIIAYILQPILYWNNVYDAKKFAFIASTVYDSSGHKYNTSRVINATTFQMDLKEYGNYSKIHLSTFFANSYGFSFASLTASISYVALFHGKSIFDSLHKNAKRKYDDVHTRLMKMNYEEVPQSWFYALLAVTIGLSIYACEGFGNQLQLKWWGVWLACLLAFVFTLPIGVIQATTNQQPGLNVITEMMIGYIQPGAPLANVTFKTYGYISMSQALTLLQDFKLGHYMKIPPKSMFFAQLVGTLVASSVYFATGWWLLESVENICNPDLLPVGSQWTCPGEEVFYNASIIWGLVGPRRMFGNLGVYQKLNWYFLIGFLAPIPVWLLSKAFPERKWIQLIHMPIIIGATGMMPPARSINFLTWGFVGVIFNYFVYKRYKKWWGRHNYVLSASLDAGLAFMAVVQFLALGSKNIDGINWWGGSGTDYCPLATCPTAPGVEVHGCPVH